MARLTLEDFDKFTDKRKVATHDPVITIGKGGRLSINKFAYENYFKLFKYVEFYYKKDKSIIALKLMKESTDNAYEIKKSVAGNFAAVNAIAFFKHHDINVSVKRNTKFLDVDEKNGIVFIKLEGVK